MDETKALSPEIKGLFDAIKMQALEYAHAFEVFESSQREYDNVIRKLDSATKGMKDELNSAISSANTSVIESLILLKNKTDETFRLGFDLKDIKSFKDELDILRSDLTQLHDKLFKQSEELDNAIKNFKKKAETEIESTLMGVRGRAERDLQNEAQKMEMRYSLRIKQIENAVINVDDDLKSLDDRLNSFARKISNEIENITYSNYSANRYSPSSYPASGIDNSPNSELGKTVAFLEERITNLSEKLAEMNAPKDKESSFSISDKVAELEKKLTSLGKQTTDSSNKNAVIVKKSSSAMAVAIFAIILSLISMAIAFL